MLLGQAASGQIESEKNVLAEMSVMREDLEPLRRAVQAEGRSGRGVVEWRIRRSRVGRGGKEGERARGSEGEL